MTFRNPAPRAIGALLVSATLLFGTGCNSDGPTIVEDTGGDVLGSWAAVSFGGSFLPIQDIVQIENRGTCMRRLDGVDLAFVDGGQYTWVEEVYIDCGDSAPSTSTNTFQGTWRVDGIHLYMQDSAAETEQEYTFTVKGKTLSMRVLVGSLQITSVFEKP